jgi:predicted NBD/HSP70 family sugar kinase
MAILRDRGSVSQAEIVRATGLSRTTVSTLVAELKQLGLLRSSTVTAPGRRGGRPGTRLLLEGVSQVVLGIDFGHSHVHVAVAGLDHIVLAERRSDLDVDHSATGAIEASVQLVDRVLAETGLERKHVIAAGIGIPGPFDRTRGVVGSTTILPGWVGLRVADEMQARLGVPVEVENDANLGALAELAWGAGRGCSNFAYVKAATGVGAGIVLDGRLLRGMTGTAGEIGHVTLDERGALCYCGNRGCLETVASGPAIVRLVGQGADSSIALPAVIELALDGNLPCRRAIADAGREIGIAVAGLCNLINPERVIVGGILSRAGDVLLDPLRESIWRHSVQAAAEGVEVLPTDFIERSELLGCLVLAIEKSGAFPGP